MKRTMSRKLDTYVYNTIYGGGGGGGGYFSVIGILL